MKAYESLWLIGDNFMSRSYGEYFLMNSSKGISEGYMRKGFDVKAYYSNKFVTNNRSVLSRIRNNLVKAVNDNYLLPKAIIMILDYDILQDLEFSKCWNFNTPR